MTNVSKKTLGEWYMLWQYDKESKVNPFEYFKDKYGRSASYIAIGDGVDIDIPMGVKNISKLIKCPKGHIKIR